MGNLEMTLSLIREIGGNLVFPDFLIVLSFGGVTPTSSDLTPLDFFLWNYLKEFVNKLAPTPGLEEEVRSGIADIEPYLREGVTENLAKRMVSCQRGHLDENRTQLDFSCEAIWRK